MTIQQPQPQPAVAPEPDRSFRARLRARRAAFADWRRRWFPEEESTVAPEVIEYLPDIEEIVARPMPRRLRVTHYLVTGLFLILVLIAAVADVDIIVVGSGRLAASKPPMVMQPLERGIIRDILVQPGDKVKRGQVLATLDPTFAQADRAQLSQQHRSLLAGLERLEAEANQRAYAPPNDADTEQSEQFNLYKQRQAEFTARQSGLDEEINKLIASIRTTEANRDSLIRQLALAREVEKMRENLYKGEVGSKLHYLDSQNTRMRVESDLDGANNRMVELRHELAAKRAERETFVNEWRRQILEQLVKDRQEAARVNEALAKATRVSDLVRLTAPEDGVVLDLAKRSVGSVVREAEPVLTLIPSDGALEVEVEIASADVGYLKPGDPVQIKVDAFPYQRHGMLEGRLRDVSQDSYSQRDDTSIGATSAPLRAGASAFHRGHVEITRTELRRLPAGAALIPGMTVSAEIKVGSRSILSFFLWPILRGMSESLREP